MPPSVSVLILNYNGREHLRDVPPDGRRASLSERPAVDRGDRQRLHRRIRGVRARTVSPACGSTASRPTSGSRRRTTTVARASASDYVVFLNNDTRVEPTWLGELVDAAAAARRPVRRVADPRLGRRADRLRRRARLVRRPLLAAGLRRAGRRRARTSAAAPLRLRRLDADQPRGLPRRRRVRRRLLRLLRGRRPRLAPGAARLPDGPRAARRHLPPAARHGRRIGLGPAAAALRAQRARDDLQELRGRDACGASCRRRSRSRCCAGSRTAASTRARLPSARRAPRRVDVPARTVVHLLALEDFGRQLPALAAKRAAIQRRRRRSDRSCAPLFGDPFRLHEAGRYEEIAARAHPRLRDRRAVRRPPARRRPGRPRRRPQPRRRRRRPPVETAAATPPLVSIVILTLLGPTHLHDCLLVAAGADLSGRSARGHRRRQRVGRGSDGGGRASATPGRA